MKIGGFTQEHEELTRTEVAAMLNPQVSARQLQKYINIARKYLPKFQKFTNQTTGELRGSAKLNMQHVQVLQEIRSLAREHTLDEIDKEFYKRASKHETDASSNPG